MAQGGGGGDGSVADWFFSQREFVIRGGALRWVDEQSAAPPVTLSDVQLVVRNTLRRHDVRVMLVNPSEVQTGFFGKVGREREPSPKKLRPQEIADAIVGMLEIDDRGFVPELSVFATNPF